MVRAGRQGAARYWLEYWKALSKMKFVLIDKIVELQEGKQIVASKSLTLAEEYLQDHFPAFPVLPGVLMIEAMVQASAWLVRASEDFRCSMVLLKEARNVSYGSFVTPGSKMDVYSQAVSIGADSSKFKSYCAVDGQTIVKARLELQHFNLSDRYGQEWKDTDGELIGELRRQFKLLRGGLDNSSDNRVSQLSQG